MYCQIDKITIHTYSVTAVNILYRKLDLTTITRAIRDATSRLTQRSTIIWISPILEYRLTRRQTRPRKRGLQLDRIHTTGKACTFSVQIRIKNK